MEHFPPSGSAGDHSRVEKSGDIVPVAGICLSQARVFSGLAMSNGLIRARSLICRTNRPEFTSYNPALHTSHPCT